MTGFTFPTLNECISPYQLIVELNNFFIQLSSASTFNFDTYVTGGTFNGSVLTLNNNTGSTFNVSGFVDTVVTAGTYNGATQLITYTNNTGGTFDVSLSGIASALTATTAAMSDDFVTAGTFDNSTSLLTFTRQSGGTFSVSLSALSDSFSALSATSSFDVITGGTYNPTTAEIAFSSYTGGNFTVSLSAISANTFVTGGTLAGDVLTYSLNDGSSVATNVSALTANDYVTGATYVSASTTLNLTTLSGNTVAVNLSALTAQAGSDDYVTGGTYNSATTTLTLTTLSGNNITVTGVNSSDRFITSGTLASNMINFVANDGYNFSVDVTALDSASQAITGGQYSGAGSSLIFSSSTGGTAFIIEGVTHTTGGTFNYSAGTLTIGNSSGGTYTVTGFTDNYITGASYVSSATTLNLTDVSGNTVSVNLSGVTSQAVLAVSGGTNISTGGTQQYPIVNLDDSITLTSINVSALTANIGNFTNITSTFASFINTSSVNISAATFYSGSTDVSELLGQISQDTNISGGSYNSISGTLQLSGFGAGVLSITGFPTTDQYITGGSFSSTSLILSGAQGVIAITGANTSDSFISGGSLSNLANLQLSGSQGLINIDLANLSGDTNITEGTLNTATTDRLANFGSSNSLTFFNMSSFLTFATGQTTISTEGSTTHMLQSSAPLNSRQWLLNADSPNGNDTSITVHTHDTSGGTITLKSATAGSRVEVETLGDFIIKNSTTGGGKSGELRIQGNANGGHFVGIRVDESNASTDNYSISLPSHSGITGNILIVTSTTATLSGSQLNMGWTANTGGSSSDTNISGGSYSAGTLLLSGAQSGVISIPDFEQTTHQDLTYAGALTYDVSMGKGADVTLGGNATLTITNMTAGEWATLIVRQDGTGGRTLTLPAGSLSVNGGAGSVTLTSNPNAVDVLSFYYDGANYFWNNGFNYT